MPVPTVRPYRETMLATGTGVGLGNGKYFWQRSETPTSPINTGTSTSGPITAANASPE